MVVRRRICRDCCKITNSNDFPLRATLVGVTATFVNPIDP